MRNRNKYLPVFFLLLISFMAFGRFQAEAKGVKAAADRKKYEKFAGIMSESIDKWESTADFADCGVITQDELNKFYQTYVNENPKYFYASINKYYIRRGQDGTMYAQITYSANARSEKAAYEKKVSSILKQVEPDWSDFEKAVFINDYIATNCKYDISLKKPHSQDAYGALVNRTAVCQGYAMAFMDLMDRLSVPCEYVSSRTMNHGWNMVKIKGKWYHVDVTWNDPVKNMEGRSRHYYLFKSTEFFRDGERGRHSASDYIVTGGIDASEAKSTKYDNYFWNEIEQPFIYRSGKWYGINSKTKELNGYVYSKKKGGFIKKNTLLSVEDRWKVWDGGFAYYSYCYSSIVKYKNILYYSTPDKIYSYNFNNKKIEEVFSYNKEKGCIYAMAVKKGKLYYYIMKAPGEDVTGKGTVVIK